MVQTRSSSLPRRRKLKRKLKKSDLKKNDKIVKKSFEKSDLRTKGRGKKRATSVVGKLEGIIDRNSKRIKLVINDSHFDIPKELKVGDFHVNQNEYFSGKVSFCMRVDALSLIKNNLSVDQLKMFKETCFGHFLDLPEVVCQGQLIHSLLLREVVSDKENEILISVNGVKLKFGLEEFALITRLKCTGECNKLKLSCDGDRLISKYFNSGDRMTKRSISDCFLSKNWDSDEDAVKLAMLFFVHSFLLSNIPNKKIKKKDVALVDSVECNDYPWGKEVFNATINSLKGKFLSTRYKGGIAKKGDFKMYRLVGFPYAFQVWFYECCPYISGKFAVCNDEKFPRILKWTASEPPSFKHLKKKLFSVSAEELKLKNVSPSVYERQMLDLNGMFKQGKEVDDRDKSNDDYDNYHHFAMLPPNTPEASSSSSSEQRHFQDIRRELHLISTGQREMKKEICCMKDKLESNFAKVFQILSTIVEKLESSSSWLNKNVPLEDDDLGKTASEKENVEARQHDNVGVDFVVSGEKGEDGLDSEKKKLDDNDNHEDNDNNAFGFQDVDKESDAYKWGADNFPHQQ